MSRTANALLVLSLALFCVHEMDAMSHAEWRLLPPFSFLEDKHGKDAFVLLHIPLFAFLFYALFLSGWKRIAAIVFGFAMVAHGTAHFLLSDHADYTFVPPIETITVYGTALASLLMIGILMRGANR